MGGLSVDQAVTIVKQTRDVFAKQEFSEKWLRAVREAVIHWQSSDKNIKPLIEALL